MTKHRQIGPPILLLVALSTSGVRAAEPPAGDVEFFHKQVQPLLTRHCFSCHGEQKQKGGLKLTARADLLEGGSRGPAAVVGEPDKSLLIQAVRHQDRLRMPPKAK